MPKDNQAELFYWVDENDNILGSITRSEAHNGSKKIHRSVYLTLTNDKDQILMQKRSMHKDTFPGFWTVSTSGHVTYPLTYEQALIKEVKEEIGITIHKYKEVAKLTYQSEQEKEIGKIFTSVHDGQTIMIDPTELETYEWVEKNQLKKWITNHPITSAAKQVLHQLNLI